MSTALSRWSALEAWVPSGLGVSDVVLAGACFNGLDGKGILGTAGTMVETDVVGRCVLLAD